jgi:omega-6 fatty acid desaturase (delta-12 desaturase)
MGRDTVFLPKAKSRYFKNAAMTWEEISHIAADSPIWTLSYLIGRQIFGWPIYLFTNDTGHNEHEKQPEGRGKGKTNGLFGGVNHFDPRSPLFEAKDAKWIILSDIGIAIMGTILYSLGKSYGWKNLLVWYFLPYLWVNHWLGKCITSSRPKSWRVL